MGITIERVESISPEVRELVQALDRALAAL
jgi:hypothetical protein